jgi:hypothetical protein
MDQMALQGKVNHRQDAAPLTDDYIAVWEPNTVK